jgi:hypothetical protein
MGTETEVVMKLISPRKARVRCEVHVGSIERFLSQSKKGSERTIHFRVWDYAILCEFVLCRKDLNEPYTSVYGIMQILSRSQF